MQQHQLEKFLDTSNLSSQLNRKLQPLISELRQPVINIEKIRFYCKNGIPDEAFRIRELCWKLLLNYLPCDRSKWQQSITKNQNRYKAFLNIFLSSQKYPNYPYFINRMNIIPGYQEDFLLWEQIEKDTARTQADFHFFLNECQQIMIPFFTSTRKQRFRVLNLQNHKNQEDSYNTKISFKFDHLTRILFIYSKLNKKIKYVQGMNQILAPIFYLINYRASEVDQAACFFMLNDAMSSVLEMHIKDLDYSNKGIKGKLIDMNKMLLAIQPKVWQHMDNLNINPLYYSFRWVTLLYAQDFEIFDVMRLWDSIFSHKDRLMYINYLAISILKLQREMILNNEFIKILQNLQKVKDRLEVLQIIKMADQLQVKYKETDFNYLCTQNKRKLQKSKKKNYLEKLVKFFS